LKAETLLHPSTNDGKKMSMQEMGELQYFAMAFFVFALVAAAIELQCIAGQRKKIAEWLIIVFITIIRC